MTNEKLSRSPGTPNEQSNLADQAAENILGPNPFIGLQPHDILASFQAIGQQAIQHPMLAVEQEAALIRDLITVLSGKSELAPSRGDVLYFHYLCAHASSDSVSGAPCLAINHKW